MNVDGWREFDLVIKAQDWDNFELIAVLCARNSQLHAFTKQPFALWHFCWLAKSGLVLPGHGAYLPSLLPPGNVASELLQRAGRLVV